MNSFVVSGAVAGNHYYRHCMSDYHYHSLFQFQNILRNIIYETQNKRSKLFWRGSKFVARLFYFLW